MRIRALALMALAVLFPSLSPFHAARTSNHSSVLSEAAETRTATGLVPAPEEVLGFRPGDDRRLASWREVVEYFRRLDAASERVQFAELGKTTMGAPFVMATISAPENLARLEEYRKIQEQLADPRLLGPNRDARARQLIARGKTIVLITCGIHSTEVGSYLSSMLIAHRLASADDPLTREILRNTIVLLVPSLNPDGVDIVKNWYDKTRGTPYEGTDPPELYHKYTGHDNNRDWYAFTQVETRITVERIHNVWHPQIVHDIHQQGANGSRLFLPPYMKPVEPNVPRQIVEGYTELGSAIAAEMRGAGFQGITTNTTYDAWTPARAYSHYHGGVRILSETASARIATPVNIKFADLRSRDPGYNPQRESPEFSPLWMGGAWHLRDITNYMTTAAFSLLKHAAQNRERWLNRFYEIGKEAIRPRKKGELSAFLIPPSDNSEKLLQILGRGGVEMDYITKSFTVNGKTFPEDTVIIRLDQPYGGFAKALLERQHYPDLRDSSGHPVAPYDVTAHTLPLLMNVEVQAINSPFRYPKGKPLLFATTGCQLISKGLVAIYKSHVPSMDEGWTRWVLEQRGVSYSVLEDKDVRASNFKYVVGLMQERNLDVIIIPDQTPRAIFEGHRKGTMPEEYTGGLGAEGVRALREFVEAGGTLVCLNRASSFAIQQFKLPVRDITEGLKRTEFYAPGSILRMELDTTHAIARGMPKESVAWVENSPVFEISDQKEAARVHLIARYPVNSDPLLSGWLLGGERLRGKAALVEVKMGRGRVILFGFRPQYRGQSLATYQLFFNSFTLAAKQSALSE